MALKGDIEQRFEDCLTNSCRQQGCTLNLKGSRPTQRTIIDGDRYIERFNPDHRMCDYIIFRYTSNTSVVVVEMKSGGINARQVSDQLHNGAVLAERAIGSTSVGKFVPLLLHKGLGSMEARVLQRSQYRVTFRGHSYLITAKRCGTSLSDVL